MGMLKKFVKAFKPTSTKDLAYKSAVSPFATEGDKLGLDPEHMSHNKDQTGPLGLNGGGAPGSNANNADRLLADIARARYNDVKKVYRPVEDAYIDRVLGFGSNSTRDQITGQSVVTTEQAAGQATAAGAGVRPYATNSGKGLSERVASAVSRGTARSRAGTGALVAAEDRAGQGKAGIIRFGQGQSEQGNALLGRTAAIEASNAIAKQHYEQQAALSRSEALGVAAGAAGTSYYLNRPPNATWGGTANSGRVIPGSTMPELTLNVPSTWNR